MGDSVVPLATVLEQWTPGDGWSWDHEEAYLHSTPCLCQNDPETITENSAPACTVRGHYQKRLEDYLRSAGEVVQPVCLGPDGRVWDGHHRIVAARRLGFATIPVEGSHHG